MAPIARVIQPHFVPMLTVSEREELHRNAFRDFGAASGVGGGWVEAPLEACPVGRGVRTLRELRVG
eukprot:4205091-Alexandrium_andersonii.AAC.1